MTVLKKTDSDIENKLVVTTGERGGKKGKLGVWDEEIQILCLK